MNTYKGERSVDGSNTYSLGSIDAPEWLVHAVEHVAESRGVSRATAVRQMLHERLAAPAETEWEYAVILAHDGGAVDCASLEDARRERAYMLGQFPDARIVRRRKAGPWLPVPGGEGEK